MAVFLEEVQVGTRGLVELKAVSELDDVHLVQVRNNLQVFGLEVGALLFLGVGFWSFGA